MHKHSHTCNQEKAHTHEHTCKHAHVTHSHNTHKHIGEHCKKENSIICIRPHSGLSGDMLLCGFASLLAISQEELNALLLQIGVETLANSVSIENAYINHVQGKRAIVKLPHEHAHRTNGDIQQILEQSSLSSTAKKLAQKTFMLLAKAEAKVHGKSVEDVTFHEVGALDSILDIALVCALYDKLVTEKNVQKIVCGALPIADGTIYCAHGYISSPAPAVLQLLENVPVTAFQGKGETVTPTAIALLKALEVEFGNWATMCMQKNVLVYGSKVFENAPNGSLFALGTSI